MRSKVVASLAIFMSLSALADKVHDLFDANRERIIASDVSIIDDVIYVVGKSHSPKRLGDSVGWSKAEDNAKWNLGNRHRATAPWGDGVTEAERDAAWLEYRSAHPNRFYVIGFQRIWSKKTSPDDFCAVYSCSSHAVDFTPPTAMELSAAVERVREKKRLAAEAAQRAKEEAARQAAEEARLVAEKAARDAAEKKAAQEAAERKAGFRKTLSNGGIRQQQLDEDMIL